MLDELYRKLSVITEEEQAILNGNATIESSIYTTSFAPSRDFTIDSGVLLKKGKLIEVRPHTRFVHFPNHKHNYVELVYMVSGTTTHIVNGTDRIHLKEGDLLFLNQNASHEILPAKAEDIAVNFIILPEFFDRSISMIEQENILRDFLLGALSGHTDLYSYLMFSVQDLPPILNLLENMIWTIFSDKKNTNTINQTTMGLVLMNLSIYVDKLSCTVPEQYEQTLIFSILKYIETHYKSGTLAEISNELKQPTYYVSRLLKKHTDKNFKELLQERKLQQAAYLLSQTSLSVEQIMASIGYDNSSYFYNRFREKYGVTPGAYRDGSAMVKKRRAHFTL